MTVKDKVKNLPNTPGVYLMKDSQNIITYVGYQTNVKALNGQIDIEGFYTF